MKSPSGTHIPLPVYRIFLIVCGLIGVTLSILWWSWPAAVDPWSAMLYRTSLFSRWMEAPGVVPAIIDLNQDTRQDGRLISKSVKIRFHDLLAHIIADDPAAIAVADSDAASALLKGLTIVDADPQAPTVFLPPVIVERSPTTDARPSARNHAAGLRSPNGKLHFNIIIGGWRDPDFSTPSQASIFSVAKPVDNRLASFLAQRVVAQYQYATADPVNEDSRIPPRPLQTQEKLFRPENNFIIRGGHHRFGDLYQASNLLYGRIPRGAFTNRVVLLGKLSGGEMPAEIGTSLVGATAMRVWAVLNGQLAKRPPWLLGIEYTLILIASFFPAAVMRSFSIHGVWIATGALCLALAGGSALAWHLHGVMVQTGVAILALWFGALNASLLISSYRNRSTNTSPASSPPQAKSLTGAPTGRAIHASSAGKARKVTNVASAQRAEQVRSPSGNTTISKSPQKKIGRYEILRCIGKGAMGEVFLGRDPRINRLTAIKTLRFKDNFAEDDIAEIRNKFFREAESAGTLSHANIVTIYDAGEDRDQAYIAMEYLEGNNLLRFTRTKGLLPVQKIIALAIQITGALDYAHRQGIVHRDIKPANVMFLKNGQIKITDFGIARITASSHTQTGVVKGTPYYMSPEQFSGDKVDGRSDIFSFGTMLFQLLTGTLPFFAERPAVLMNQIMNFPHPNLRAINPRVIAPIVPIVDKTLEKDRAKRYQRAGQVAVDLAHLKKQIDRYLQNRKQC